MAKKATPILRKGLKVTDLLSGSWMVKEDRYSSEDEIEELVDEILMLACSGLIAAADEGGRVTRRTVINTLSSAANILKAAKDHITDKMGKGKLAPSVLDRLADV